MVKSSNIGGWVQEDDQGNLHRKKRLGRLDGPDDATLWVRVSRRGLRPTVVLVTVRVSYVTNVLWDVGLRETL